MLQGSSFPRAFGKVGFGQLCLVVLLCFGMAVLWGFVFCFCCLLCWDTNGKGSALLFLLESQASALKA